MTSLTVMVVTRESLEQQLSQQSWMGTFVKALAARFRETDQQVGVLRGRTEDAPIIQRVLEVYGVRVEPVYMGKPFGPIFEHNHRLLEDRAGRKIPRGRVVMLGDSIASDIRGANDFGYRSALLLTGVTREMHLSAAAAKPDLIFRGF